MNAPIFKVKEIDDSKIEVVLLNEWHSYTMMILKDENGRRFLNGTIRINGTYAKHDAEVYAADARCFAETEARKAGIID